LREEFHLYGLPGQFLRRRRFCRPGPAAETAVRNSTCFSVTYAFQRQLFLHGLLFFEQKKITFALALRDTLFKEGMAGNKKD